MLNAVKTAQKNKYVSSNIEFVIILDDTYFKKSMITKKEE